MKLPKKIKVGYKTFKIIYDKNMLRDKNLLGKIYHREFKIILQTPAEDWDEGFILEVIAHEFAHAYYLENNNEINTEENCDRFASMFMMMAKNMGWLE